MVLLSRSNRGVVHVPADATLFVSLVVVAFISFGLALAWAQRCTTR